MIFPPVHVSGWCVLSFTLKVICQDYLLTVYCMPVLGAGSLRVAHMQFGKCWYLDSEEFDNKT